MCMMLTHGSYSCPQRQAEMILFVLLLCSCGSGGFIFENKPPDASKYLWRSVPKLTSLVSSTWLILGQKSRTNFEFELCIVSTPLFSRVLSTTCKMTKLYSLLCIWLEEDLYQFWRQKIKGQGQSLNFVYFSHSNSTILCLQVSWVSKNSVRGIKKTLIWCGLVSW